MEPRPLGRLCARAFGRRLAAPPREGGGLERALVPLRPAGLSSSQEGDMQEVCLLSIQNVPRSCLLHLAPAAGSPCARPCIQPSRDFVCCYSCLAEGGTEGQGAALTCLRLQSRSAHSRPRPLTPQLPEGIKDSFSLKEEVGSGFAAPPPRLQAEKLLTKKCSLANSSQASGLDFWIRRQRRPLKSSRLGAAQEGGVGP